MMKKTTCTIFILTGLFLFAVLKEPMYGIASAEKPNSVIEKAILETHDKIIAAAEKQDADALFGYILDNEKTVIIQDGRLFTRQQALDMIKESYTGTAKIEYSFEQRLVNVLSPTTAILTAAGNVTVTLESGESFSTQFANTSVFTLQEDGWKIIHGHHSIPNPRF